MSRPDDFSRLDTAGDHTADRFERFKARAESDREYREAYARVAAVDPQSAAGLPHPDAHDTDPVHGLEMVKNLRSRLVADPGLNLKLD